ncbi:uncharacterized protein LOC142230912 [Haematobia irritans]|uniref:uncharacterized protein LOC142230912 n=1 Tax=Haematobia irritans TaxID=7368 RepID=UPI003F4FF8FB
MVTHATSYELLRNLQLLDEPAHAIPRDDQLKLIRHDVRRYISQAYERNKQQYNLRARPISFTVGQSVFRRNFVQSSAGKQFNAKLSPIFVKATIKEKIGNNYYVLADEYGKIVGTYHAKDIRT